ncbi:MAG: hypothetical protein K0S70_289 [Microbacterium sp.]|jgi:LacI family transcriptional regulator|nr:hypothetical protein [Microbacterium sp.]MDQ1075360.1 LacI family transcriptional regulator [Microbacterium sp. SORGH_AS_0969]MDQ1115591.1 LacI family transcriptional regulator [Microbacterium testaceum]
MDDPQAARPSRHETLTRARRKTKAAEQRVRARRGVPERLEGTMKAYYSAHMADSRVPTLKDVARGAGVHVATASRALSDDQSHLVSEATRLRVRTAARSLGYRTNAVAKSLRKGRTGTIGVVVADLANPFIVSLLRGIEHEARAGTYMPLVAETHDDPAILRGVVARLLGNQVDCIILSAVKVDDEDFVTELESQVPVVLAVRGFEAIDGADQGHFEVIPDDFEGARLATRHLIDLGHRRIAQIPGTVSISSFVRRARGFDAAVSAHPRVVDVSTGEYAVESTVDEGRRLAQDVLRRPEAERPTAIFAHNDLMAVGVLDAVRSLGLRCPEDISIVGYNDAPLIDHLDPPLTTVRLPGFEVGRQSARIAFDLLEGVEVPTARLTFAPEFVERRSTCPPPSPS